MTQKADAETLPQANSSVYRRIAAPVALFALVAILYLPSIHNGFVYDDYDLIVEQPVPRTAGAVLKLFAEREVEESLPYYRPLPRVTHVVQKYLHHDDLQGDRPGPYHLFNVVLIAVVAVAAYYLFRSPVLEIPPLWALLGAALWAVHPIASSCVYPIVSGRDTLLPVLFILLAVCAYLRPGRVWFGLALAMFALGLLCKELAIVTPALFVLADLCVGEKGSGLFCAKHPEGRSGKRVLTPFLLRYAPVAAVVLGYLAIRLALFAGEGSHQLTVFTAPFGPLLSVVYFLQTSMVPFAELLYEPRLSVWASPWRYPIVLVSVGILAVAIWRQWPEVRGRAMFWLGWIVVTLLPTANLLDQQARFAERYGYLALLGLVGLAATAASAWPGSVAARRVMAGVAVGLLVVLATVSLHRGKYFKDNLTFLTHWVDTDPESAQPYSSLGEHYLRHQQLDQAIASYNKCLPLAPNAQAASTAHNNLGIALARQGNWAQAPEHYEQALRLRPNYAEAHINWGVALAVLGRAEEAVTHYEEALRIKPDNAKAHNNLGGALAGLGHAEEAVTHYQEALRINPDYASAHNNWGVTLAGLGRAEEAVTHYEEALRIKPDYAKAHNNWGNALQDLGRLEEAIAHYQEALRIKPDYAEAHENLRRSRSQQKLGSDRE